MKAIYTRSVEHMSLHIIMKRHFHNNSLISWEKNPQYVVQMPILEINLDLSDTVQPFTLSSVGSTPNKDKYLEDDIKVPTPWTPMYIKGRTTRIIKVAEGIVMPSHIFNGPSVPIECAVVEVTTIREGREFEDLDYPNEEEGIEKLVDA
jgi:hypothetical protein